MLTPFVAALACFVARAGLEAHPGGDFGFSTKGEGGYFIRGDSNQDGKVDLADAIATLGYLFLGDELPYCLDALDADDDGQVIITDAIATLGFLFLGQSAIPRPFPTAGLDPTADSLNCDNGAFAHIRREIFATTCATASCHSRQASKGGLVLEGMLAYSQLYQYPSVNEAARAAGLLRVKPGSLEKSFLYKKITGDLVSDPDPAKDEGVRMPNVEGQLLSDEQIALVEHWIRDGATPSTPDDIILPRPTRGDQILVPAFPVPAGQESQWNYYFHINKQDPAAPDPKPMWVNRVEFLYPPGSHHLNFFSWIGDGPQPTREEGSRDPAGFAVVPFETWGLRASSQTGRLDWRLPTGVAMRFEPNQLTLSQIHFVNIGSQTSPIGGCACINLHATEPAAPPSPLGALFMQNKNILIPPQSTVSWDYGITFDHYGHTAPIRLAAVTGHFHWRGKTFEVRLWDGLNKNADGTPAAGEFERMGPENMIYLSDNWDEPPFILYGDDGPEVPAGWGVVYRSTYVNTSDIGYCFGPHVETQEHSNLFVYGYPWTTEPDPDPKKLFDWFPPTCLGQGCTVPCSF